MNAGDCSVPAGRALPRVGWRLDPSSSLLRNVWRRLSAFGTVAQADPCGGYCFGKQVKLVSGKRFCCLNLDKVVRGKITIGRIALVKAVRENYSRKGGSARSPSRRWLGGNTLGEVVRLNYSRECDLRKVLSGRWFGGITVGRVARGNYSPRGASAELFSGTWFGEITLQEMVRPNYSPTGASGKLLCGRSFGREITLRKVRKVLRR